MSKTSALSQSGQRAYRNLDEYSAKATLEADGWHVDYELKNAGAQSGGPYYVINPRDGKIVSKRYEQ